MTVRVSVLNHSSDSPHFFKGGGEESEFYFTPSEGGNSINYKKGWVYGIGVGLLKGGGDTFLDKVFQGYHFYINSLQNFTLKFRDHSTVT